MVLADRIDLDFDTPKSLPDLGVYKVVLHILQIGFQFLVMCLAASVISTERTFYQSSQAAVNYTLIISLLSLFVSTPLAIYPWTRLSKAPYPTIRSFFLRLRTSLIFTCFFSFAWFISMISMSLHSGNESNCNLDSSMIKKYPNYQSAWRNQCNCAKAVTAFSYLLFFFWMGASICSAILLWHEKKQRHIGEHHSEESKKGETDSFETDNQTVTNAQDALDSIPKQTIPISNDEPDRFVCHHSPPSTINLSYSPLIHEPNSPYEGLQRPVSTIIAPYTPSPLIMSPQAPLQQPYYSSDNLPNVAHVHGNSAYYSSPHATANLPYQSLHSPYSSSDYSNTNMSYPFNPSHYASQ